MENKMMTLLEDIKSLVKANIEGQKAFEERFERRPSKLENEMASIEQTVMAVIKEISNVRTDLKQDIADVKNALALLEDNVEKFKEKIVLSNRKNETWFDLLAKEYGRLRLDLDFLKEEFSQLTPNA